MATYLHFYITEAVEDCSRNLLACKVLEQRTVFICSEVTSTSWDYSHGLYCSIILQKFINNIKSSLNCLFNYVILLHSADSHSASYSDIPLQPHTNNQLSLCFYLGLIYSPFHNMIQIERIKSKAEIKNVHYKSSANNRKWKCPSHFFSP